MMRKKLLKTHKGTIKKISRNKKHSIKFWVENLIDRKINLKIQSKSEKAMLVKKTYKYFKNNMKGTNSKISQIYKLKKANNQN